MKRIVLGLTIFLSLIISGTASAQTISSQFKAENPAHAVTWALLTWASSDKRGLDFELTENMKVNEFININEENSELKAEWFTNMLGLVRPVKRFVDSDEALANWIEVNHIHGTVKELAFEVQRLYEITKD
ncbi:hypothetical protein HBN50_10190 [Halobacteriovorax sp. GB3]|uniref:hypothetical protein n=1 Tax=Halobacteriovorax sp. GB3 TaxID=2719615 RepID=UPI0023620AC3|nr:hypothetical protein [Halobacteriovorax sp. GB3]MDD0853470.1 hypothetical protein [Halobacteriovorax sp. GB3]